MHQNVPFKALNSIFFSGEGYSSRKGKLLPTAPISLCVWHLLPPPFKNPRSTIAHK